MDGVHIYLGVQIKRNRCYKLRYGFSFFYKNSSPIDELEEGGARRDTSDEKSTQVHVSMATPRARTTQAPSH